MMKDVAHVVAGRDQKKRFCDILLPFLAAPCSLDSRFIAPFACFPHSLIGVLLLFNYIRCRSD